MRMWKTESKICRPNVSNVRGLAVSMTAMGACLLFGVQNHSSAQDNFSQPPAASATPSSDGLGQAFESRFSAGQQEPEMRDPWQFAGRLHLEKGTSQGYLVLQVDLDPGHYIYSVSPQGSPAPTQIRVATNPAVKTTGEFSPNVQPEVNENDPVFQRRIEKHKGRVQFFVPCQLNPNADFQATGMLEIEFNGQVCSQDGVCIPINAQKVAVSFAGYFERENQSANNAAPSSDKSESRR